MVGTFKQKLGVANISHVANNRAICGTYIVFVVRHSEVSRVSW